VGFPGFAAIALLALPGFFSVRDRAGYEHPEATLQQLVDSRGHRGANHLCVVGYQLPSGHGFAWVYWPEDHAMILWEPTRPGSHWALARSRRYLDLDKDVVATDDDVQGSTYLVTRAWVARTIAECRAHGDSFVVRRRAHRH
jgi:hypothetical protein